MFFLKLSLTLTNMGVNATGTLGGRRSSGQVEKSLRAKNQLNSSIRFDTVPAFDRRTDGQTDTRRQHIPR